MSFPAGLFLSFLVMKLVGIIDWSWWWVTAPLWGSAVIFLTYVAVGSVVVGILAWRSDKKSNDTRRYLNFK